MTVHTFCDNWSIKAHIQVVISRAQIPNFFFTVPGDGHFIDIAALTGQISTVVIARSNNVVNLATQFMGSHRLVILTIFYLIITVFSSDHFIVQVILPIIDMVIIREIFNIRLRTGPVKRSAHTSSQVGLIDFAVTICALFIAYVSYIRC